MNPLKHVAIIMDGNGRWGLKRKKSRNFGHKEGLKNLKEIIKASISKKIKFLTLFAFSTENWKRPKKEIKLLFRLLNNYIDNEIQEFIKEHNIQLIKVNVTKYSDASSALLKEYNILGLPTLILLKNNNIIINRISGKISRESVLGINRKNYDQNMNKN